MASHVDLYNNAYAQVEHEIYRAIRTDTYGRDLGQTSWVSTDESKQIPSLLQLGPGSHVLELGSGSGIYALYVALECKCLITGLDLNASAINAATQLTRASGQQQAVHFQQADASQPLPFQENSLDAAFANDVLCHVPNRPALFRELLRVLRPGGRLLFSDALIIGGILSHEEIATRSSIGPYFFSPPGENERLLTEAGFHVLSVTDTSEQATNIADRWYHAREQRRQPLIAIEGLERYAGLQRFLARVRQLTAERRLLRKLYVAEKNSSHEGGGQAL